MKILIIGSRGFIGSSLLEYYRSDKNVNVFHCDIFQLDVKDITYFKIDSDNLNFETIFKEGQFDICINASGSGSVSFSNSNPLKDYELNTLNVFLILNAIKTNNPTCKFINFSSAAVYGNSLHFPIVETQALNPVAPYGWHKLMSEIICKEFYVQHKISTLSLRIFSVYGPGLKKQLFWDIYQKTLSSKTINMEGSGKETRDFIFIYDLCHAVEKLIVEYPFDGDVVNVASGEETSIEIATELFLNKLNQNFQISFNNNSRLGDPTHYIADISKLKEIGFTPKYSFEKGIEEYALWLQEKK